MALAGFTLIELLVVIIVLGLLAGLVAPQILGRVSEARIKTAKTQIEMLGVALDNYRLDNGSYPTTDQGLEALVTKPTRSPLPLSAGAGHTFARRCHRTRGDARTSIGAPESTLEVHTIFRRLAEMARAGVKTRTLTQ